MLTSIGRVVNNYVTEDGSIVSSNLTEFGRLAYVPVSNISFSFSIDTTTHFTDSYVTGSFELGYTSEYLFLDKHFDFVYLDSNTTEFSFSANFVASITGSTSFTLDSDIDASAVFGNIGSVYFTQNSDTLLSGSVNIFGGFVFDTYTNVFFDNSGIFGSFAFDNQSICSLSAYLGIAGSFVFEQPTISSIFGYFSNTNTDIGSLSGAIKTHCMNLNTQGMSQYTNYNFNSFFMVGGKYYGCSTDGTFLLSGDLDNATTIAQSVVQTATSDFNTQKLKGARDVYAYVRSTGDMLVTVTTNEQIERGNYPLYYDNIDGIHRRRVKIAQGIKGTSWGAIVKNDSGADFTIKQVDIIPVELERSV